MPMRVNALTVTPVALRAGREQSQSSTLGYLSGSAVLGALAGAHQQLGRDRAEFKRWFLSDARGGGGLRVSNLYPGPHKRYGELGPHSPVLPVPMTARTCKRFPGCQYQAQADDEVRHGLQDALVPLALFDLSGQTALAALKPLDQCPYPKCEEALDRVTGFYSRGSGLEQVTLNKARLLLRTHTGVNPKSGTVASEVLYNQQAIAPETPLYGEWALDDPTPQAQDAFEAFLEAVFTAGLFRLGNSRTRGLGRIQCAPTDFDADSEDDIKARVVKFTERFKEHAAALGIQAHAEGYVPISLSSDLLLQDVLLRPQLKLIAEVLQAEGVPNAQLIYCAAGTRRIEGWSDLWGRPKADQMAIAMGSVFLFALTAPTPDTYNQLQRLQAAGLGLRRAEGFGRVRVADSFHVDFHGVMR